MKNQKSGTETCWHKIWALPMPVGRAAPCAPSVASGRVQMIHGGAHGVTRPTSAPAPWSAAALRRFWIYEKSVGGPPVSLAFAMPECRALAGRTLTKLFDSLHRHGGIEDVVVAHSVGQPFRPVKLCFKKTVIVWRAAAPARRVREFQRSERLCLFPCLSWSKGRADDRWSCRSARRAWRDRL